jgi:hypothetical protein
MRQTTSGLESEFCSVDPDHKVVSLKVLPSTFNQPNQEYVVRIESNFVKQNNTNEPMIGNEFLTGIAGKSLIDLNWKLSTGNYQLFYRFFFLIKKIY